MRTLERKPAPNWKRLRVAIGNSKRGKESTSGYAYYDGYNHGGVRGDRWAVFLGLPHEFLTERRVARLMYHELMHTYGYNHKQYRDPTFDELETAGFGAKAVAVNAVQPSPKIDRVKIRYLSMLRRQKQWAAKYHRARNALQKVDREIRSYKKKYADRVA
jgi:hypothetical protein